MADGGEVSYVIATGEYREQIIDFINQYFIPNEPTCVAVGLKVGDVAELWQYYIEETIEFPVSILALDKKTKELIGLRLSTIVNLENERRSQGPTEQEAEQLEQVEALRELENPVVKVLDFDSRLQAGKCDLEPLCNHKIGLKLLAVCVNPAHYRKGIASESIRRSLAAGRSCDATVAFVSAVAYKSQQMFARKLGFRTVKTIRHTDFVGKDGQQIIKCKDGLTETGLFMVKEL